MPSRIVDHAWHEFILDSASYIDFCDRAYGEYLHHIPEGDTELDSARGRSRGRSCLGPKRGRTA